MNLPVALIDHEGRVFLTLEYASETGERSYMDTVELSGPSRRLELRTKTVQVIGYVGEKVQTRVDGEGVLFERARSNYSPLLTAEFLTFLMEGQTFYTIWS